MTDHNDSGSLQQLPGLNPPEFYSLSMPEEGGTLRHDKYYIPSGDIVFKVEDTLFRVHRYFFERDSPVFKDMLSLPQSPDNVLEGMSDENPIHLPQVTATEFAHFLWVFYNPKYSIYDASMDAWIAILRLAHRWEFAEVRELAFRELDRMHIPPVTRLVLAEKYDAAPDWYAKTLTELETRAASFKHAELGRLGPVMKSKVNEILRRNYLWTRRRVNPPRPHAIHHPSISDIQQSYLFPTIQVSPRVSYASSIYTFPRSSEFEISTESDYDPAGVRTAVLPPQRTPRPPIRLPSYQRKKRMLRRLVHFLNLSRSGDVDSSGSGDILFS